MTKPALFALDDSSLGAEVATLLDVAPSPYEFRKFEDGEFKIRPLANVRGLDVYVLFGLHGEEGKSAADKLCELLFFAGALKDAGARRVTAVAPYLSFARKDRRTKPRDPVTTRYVAQLIEAMRIDRVITVDAHNLSAFQNSFRCEAVHLDAQALFARHFAEKLGDAPLAVVSPDLGGEKRAELFRRRVERLVARPVAKAFMDKYRSEGRVESHVFAGDVKDRVAIVLDDLISGGGTVARAAVACRQHGAAAVHVAATHGVLSSAAAETLPSAPIDEFAITDSIPCRADIARALSGRLSIIPVAPLLAEGIRRCHAGESISDLVENGP